MSRSVTLFLIGLITLNAQDSAPVSPNAPQGKTVYTTIIKPVNLTEEARIQKEDQNITKLGEAK